MYRKIREFSTYLRTIQLKGDNDQIIAVTGVKGTGKSTFSIQISRDYLKAYYGKVNFPFTKHSAYNNEEVIAKIHGLDMHMPLIADEAVRFAWSRDWNVAENKELVRLATQIRTKKLIMFLNLPVFSKLDKVWRDSLIDLWVWIHYIITKRGKRCFAFLFVPDLNQGQPDPWHLDLFKKRIRNRVLNQFTDFGTVKNYMRKHPCYFDSFEYPALPDSIYQTYKEIRDARAFETQEQKFDKQAIVEAMIYNIRNNFPKIKDDVEHQKGPIKNRKYCNIDIIHRHIMLNPITTEQLMSKGTVTKCYKEAEEAVFKAKPEKKKKEREKEAPVGSPTIVQDAFAMDNPKSAEHFMVPNSGFVELIPEKDKIIKTEEVIQDANDSADRGSEEETGVIDGEGDSKGDNQKPEIVRQVSKEEIRV